ncbi:Alpha/Beta hydrolase protein [Fimicolochytrium jonesii]|uniref:Alpha/Beta hydrolase protein n=1 Tax=Fimicolochytrium jonesii TaxID=1396493 RepID=UPI0022FE1E72|nr:Alpha/Beta hydrolase protein [Fimicolochytrium jonesii]KAI8819824.1 Alpha/Beta hydrolase protein [Fimicolochytrium jonesii]
MSFASATAVAVLLLLLQLACIYCVYIAHVPPAITNWKSKWIYFGVALVFSDLSLTILAINVVLFGVAAGCHVFDDTSKALAVITEVAFAANVLALLGSAAVGLVTAKRVIDKELQKMQNEGHSGASKIKRGSLLSYITSIRFIFASLLPYWRPLGLTMHSNITYLTSEEMSSLGITDATEQFVQLDVITSNSNKKARTSPTHPRPVFMYIHGGAWSMGDKQKLVTPICWHMAQQGWVVVNINYRMNPLVKYPEHLIDCKRALRWIRLNISKFGGDPAFVVVSGGSAGGHLASMMALTPNEPSFQPGFESISTELSACVPYYPVVDVTNASGYPQGDFGLWFATSVSGLARYDEAWLRKNACPISLVPGQTKPGEVVDGSKAKIPPFLIFQGHNDNIVPHPTVRAFEKKLRAVETTVPPHAHDSSLSSTASHRAAIYMEFPYAHHAFDVFINPRTNLVSWTAGQYLNGIYAEWESTQNNISMSKLLDSCDRWR